ncbi:MAG: hypothetical protein HRU19_31160 [Pseudobacteriovorax sp.]|nr:hypothetical protein [Pseudobacteriovorax sp.]
MLDRYKNDQINGSSYDPDSIMVYSFPASLTKNGISSKWNSELSEMDKEMARRVYPKI